MISAKGLLKCFNQKVVLNKLNLDIYEGKSLAILGPSGAGKSVLVKCILGLIDFDAGEIIWRGKRLQRDNKIEDRDGFSYVFQFAGLLDSLTLLENIIFPSVRRNLKSKKQALLDAIQISTKLGIEQYLERLPKEVPLSIRKLGAVARAVVSDAEIIFLDEPDTGLDPQAVFSFYSVIQEHFRAKSKTLVVISHDVPEVLSLCDRYALIYNGTIVAEGEVRNNQVSNANEFITQFLKGEVDGPIRLS